MSPASVPTRGRRHPMTVVTRARELHHGGLEASEIVAALAAEGVTVAPRSVRRWTDQRVARASRLDDRKNAARKARLAGGQPMGSKRARPEYKLARMAALHAHGVSFPAIAKTMNFDFGDHLSEHQVSYALRVRSYPTQIPD